MDVCAIEDGVVYYEESIDNVELAKEPEKIISALKEAFPVDVIAGPSGYGVEPTRIEDVLEDVFEEWYYNFVLLTTKADILRAIEDGVLGAVLYKNMADFSVWMKREGLPVIFIPSVIELPTVPLHRKVNKIDMGTADKMAVAVLGVYDQSRRLKVPYSEVSFILVEVGFGYNAVVGVEGGAHRRRNRGDVLPGPWLPDHIGDGRRARPASGGMGEEGHVRGRRYLHNARGQSAEALGEEGPRG
jgi:predicted butyrate kinase (DUF1464 family)